jgi:hypothetical protein
MVSERPEAKWHSLGLALRYELKLLMSSVNSSSHPTILGKANNRHRWGGQSQANASSSKFKWMFTEAQQWWPVNL